MFDESRSPQPSPTPSNEYKSDWFHINSSVYDTNNNIYVSSSRQQNIIVATDGDYIQGSEEDISGIRWILGSPQSWENEDVFELFLTPFDVEGLPLYDLTNLEELELANSKFFSWAQHSIYPVEFDDDIGTSEFLIFDDGNYSSYNQEYWIPPDLNSSRRVHNKVDEINMMVEKIDNLGLN